MVGETLRQNLNMRIGNTKGTVQRELEIIKGAAGGLRERFGRNPQEPSIARGIGGALGQVKGAADIIPVVAIRTADNLQTHGLGFARANRALIFNRG